MRRSDTTTNSLPHSERAGGLPPPSLPTQLLFSTWSTSSILLSTGVQLRTPRWNYSLHFGIMLRAQPWAGELAFADINYSLRTPCLALMPFIRQNSHLTFEDHAKSAGYFQVMTWWSHLVGYTLKLRKICGDPRASCLLFSTWVSCLLIAWGNYPLWYNPGLL